MALAALGIRDGIRVLSSWTADRVFWIELEALSKDALTAAMRGFGVRLAKAINKRLARTGAVLADRYELVVPVAVPVRERVKEALATATGKTPAPKGVDPPLLAAAKAMLTFAVAPFALRTLIPPIAGGGRMTAEDWREVNRAENEHIRDWRRSVQSATRKWILEEEAADRELQTRVHQFHQQLIVLEIRGPDVDQAGRDLLHDLRASAKQDQESRERLRDWQEERSDARADRRRAKAEREKKKWWKFWR